MAYRYEKNLNGEYDLVIDGFENGIADSPFLGIGNMRNVNVSNYPGVAYMNYKRKPTTLTNAAGVSSMAFTVTIASPAVFTATAHGLVDGSRVVFTTTGSLPTGLSANTPYYVISAGLTADNFRVSSTFQGTAINTSGSQSGTHTLTIVMSKPRFYTKSPLGLIYIQDDGSIHWKQTAVNGSTFSMLTGGSSSLRYGLQFWNNYLLSFAQGTLHICGDGTGDAGITSSNWNTGSATTGVWPVNSAVLTLTGTPSAGDTSATLSSYTDSQGASRAFWNGPTGTYLLQFGLSGGGSQTVYVSATQGSATLDWYPALNANASSATPVLRPFVGISDHPSIVSLNDGNAYVSNDNYVASFEQIPNQIFTKGNMKTFAYNAAALTLPSTEIVTSFSEIVNLLLVGSYTKIYPWDRFSPQWKNPIPIGEQIKAQINLLNNVYIFAGNKGNIYISNGYSAEKFRKIPDYIAGSIDPNWQWGGIMAHIQKLYFQVLGTNSQSSANAIAGIMSLDIKSGAVSVEAQNSFGVVSSTTEYNGLLIDNNAIPSPLAYANYYSAYTNADIGGLDFNNTELWSGSEALIETEIIPIGTFAQNRTFISAEFKLDQPLQSGDSISLYARKSLSDSYVLLGTTTTATLSDFYDPLNFEQWQWIQFKIVPNCNATATSSSFTRIREVRIR